jgi:hypothetical protein
MLGANGTRAPRNESFSSRSSWTRLASCVAAPVKSYINVKNPVSLSLRGRGASAWHHVFHPTPACSIMLPPAITFIVVRM